MSVLHNKYDPAKLDLIVNNIIKAMNISKGEIFQIAELAREECANLEGDLKRLKHQTVELIDTVEVLENELKESKKRLALINKNLEEYGGEELKAAYSISDELSMQLSVMKEKEQLLIKQRNDLEIRIKDSNKTFQRAESFISNLGIAAGYLTGDLQKIEAQGGENNRIQNSTCIIKAQEDERLRIARDIHDGPAQWMSNVVLKAELCEILIDSDFEKTRLELQNLKAITRECLNDVRKIIYDLRPMSLDDLGLIPTLNRYILFFQENSGIETSFKSTGVFDDIKPAISLTVFRVVQEALNNIKKYSQAQNTVINLEFSDNELKLYIFDDGIGFNLEEIGTKIKDINSGYGLIGIRERVELLNGKLKITTRPHKGTRINVLIPLDQKGEF